MLVIIKKYSSKMFFFFFNTKKSSYFIHNFPAIFIPLITRHIIPKFVAFSVINKINQQKYIIKIFGNLIGHPLRDVIMLCRYVFYEIRRPSRHIISIDGSTAHKSFRILVKN